MTTITDLIVRWRRDPEPTTFEQLWNLHGVLVRAQLKNYEPEYQRIRPQGTGIELEAYGLRCYMQALESWDSTKMSFETHLYTRLQRAGRFLHNLENEDRIKAGLPAIPEGERRT